MSVSSGDCESIDYEALEQELLDKTNTPLQSLNGDGSGNGEATNSPAANLDDFDVLVAEAKEILKQHKGRLSKSLIP